MAKRTVLLGGLFHETHTFLHQKTGLEQFYDVGINIGPDVISRNRGNGSPTDGFLGYAAENDWRIVPTIQMAASPSGMVTEEAIEFFNRHFFEVFEQECERVDGIFLVLHGAMVAKQCDDVEGALLGEIYRRLRAKNLSIPVVAVIDLHGNISRDMTDFSTC
ncbi:MAG: M81 family metallopeptidase, partial [Alphaproteobacteria bacterium]|nr:M81 family metallopeptidase [Alphaproteobacteria bacterium]